jgi:mannose-6-phosphate isomerase-like protein (cupin superfamily)
MQSAVRTAAVAALAFTAGIAATHLVKPAEAQGVPLLPISVDVGAMTADSLPPPNPAVPTLRSRTLAATDGATVAVQIGTVGKHVHNDANEIQYVVSGSGTEVLGDQTIVLHPGMLLVIPKGTPHAGTTDPNLKILAIKTPPQAASDTHFVP